MSAVPKLRFKEFEGEWRPRPLANPSDFTKGKGIAKSDIHIDGTTPCIRYGELYTEYGEVISDVISRTNVDDTELKLSEGNEVLIPASGEVAWDIATAACVQSSGIALGGDINVLKTEQHGSFLAYYIGGKLKPKVARLAQGNSVVHVYGQQLSTLIVNFPSLPEQKKIADFLAAVDDMIAGLRAREALLSQYKQGVMQKIFSQALRFKADDGSVFPDWETIEFEHALHSLPTRNYQIQSNQYKSEGRYPVIDQGKELIVGYSDDESKLYVNDSVIVFGDHTTVLKYIDFDFIVGADGTKILQTEKYNLKYLYYYLLLNNVEQEGYKRHFSILRQIKLIVPHPDEQQKIADFLSAIDDKISIVSAQITQMQDFKKGLLQQMFV